LLRLRAFSATLQCTASYRFADGQLVATGVIRFGAPGRRGTARR
jgi:hypothetical protein